MALKQTLANVAPNPVLQGRAARQQCHHLQQAEGLQVGQGPEGRLGLDQVTAGWQVSGWHSNSEGELALAPVQGFKLQQLTDSKEYCMSTH